MITIIYLASLASLAHSGLITHDVGGDDDHNRATSFQNIHMEHFHAVPTYVKKEYKHLLEHPIPVGKSSSKVEIHHGGKHDHGYAIVDAKNNARGSGGYEGAGFEGHDFSGSLNGASLGGHEGAGLGGDEGASLGGHGGASLGDHDASSQLAAQALANAALAHGGSGYQVHDKSQELLQHQAAQIQLAQSHGALQLQAAAALNHGDLSGHYPASGAREGHRGYEAVVASALQNGLGGHGHS